MLRRSHLTIAALGVLMFLSVGSRARDICNRDPFTRRIETGGQTVVIHGSPVAGSPSAARHQVLSGVCGAYLVIRGTVSELTPVRVLNTDGDTHTLITIEVAQSWKADAAGCLSVRLLDDLAEPFRGRPDYAPFAVGDECLMYLDRDSQGDLLGSPASLVLRDSEILGLWGVVEEIPKASVFALVDSCAAARGLESMVRIADLVVEGNVESSWEDWLGSGRTACSVRLTDLVVHKGSMSEAAFELRNKRGGSGWAGWPVFHDGDRVLLFLQGDAVTDYRLIGDWQGKWQLRDGDMFHVGSRAVPRSLGIVSADETVRASPAPARAFSRSQLVEALLKGNDTQSD